MVLAATLVVDNIGALATMDGASGLGFVVDAVVACDRDRVVYAGPRAGAPAFSPSAHMVDAGGRAVMPGLIDCHTHNLFAGDRADEFARRARGESYAQIMAAGGGIRSTMAKVRALSVDELVAASLPRLQSALARGVTTMELKSGYGLDAASEIKMLYAARALAAQQPMAIEATLLAAHAVPPEHATSSSYVDVIVRDIMPEVVREKLASTCDIFIEQNAFSLDDGRRLLRAAQERGLAVRVHAEQLSHQGGALLAAELGARSAGHLEFVDEHDIEALAKAGVVCEVLALAQVFLRGQRATPGRALVDGGCVVAVATDSNPGTAMSTDIALAAGLSVTQCGLSVEEALRGITVNAARALALSDRGVLAAGKRADMLVLCGTSPVDLVYRWGEPQVQRVIVGGSVVEASCMGPAFSSSSPRW
ncbi:MAG TPA: imidazolonepropionase [Myxococcota bacterium]|jgi:imidazolonepropionase